MRFSLVALFIGLCAFTSSASVNYAPENVHQKQHDVNLLFKYVNQPSYYQQHQAIANNYDVEANQNHYSKPEVVQHFMEYYKYGMLPKGEIFSAFNEQHLKQAIALFKLFYYAKDYDSFYKTAVWARQYCNEGMFVYSFSVALVHRPDTYYLLLPPIHEVYPYYFFSSEVIHKAQYYKQLYYGGHGNNQNQNYNNQNHHGNNQNQNYNNQNQNQNHHGNNQNQNYNNQNQNQNYNNQHQNYNYNHQIIYANYSGHYLNLHPEQSLSYFTEDVGVNSYYYYYNLYYPSWMDKEEFHAHYDNYGEFFYYFYQQILARYYLERLSNGFGEIEYYNYDLPFPVGYYPSLSYHNGLEFPTRPNYAHLHEYFYNYGQKYSFKGLYGYSYSLVQNYERHINDAVDSGYIYAPNGQYVNIYSEDGFNMFGQLVNSHPHSPYYKYYGAYEHFARHLLGYSYQPNDNNQVYPSALEHYETSLRDPAFYMLYKKLILYFQKYKYYLKPYSKEELHYNGVKVENVHFDQLITYYDYLYSDITNAVYVTPEEAQHDSFRVSAAQQAIHHKPFSYKVNVNSDKEADCVVRVYIGPKYDEYGRAVQFNENRVNFVQFDHFKYHMKAGQNAIVRNSHEIHNYMHDRANYQDIHQKVHGAYNESQYFHYNDEQFVFGFPHRFMLPKGSHEGHAYQMYVMVSPYKPYNAHEGMNYPLVGCGHQYVDGYPMGYPFDRHIEHEHYYYEAPNSYFHEVKVYHKEYNQLNVPH